MIPPLITIADMKAHANLDRFDVAALELKIMQASAMVMKHIKLSEFPVSWSNDPDASPINYDVPFDIQASVMLLTAELWEHREASDYAPSENWKRMLVGYRDPTMA